MVTERLAVDGSLDRGARTAGPAPVAEVFGWLANPEGIRHEATRGLIRWRPAYQRTQSGMTLEEFLRWPRIDEKPYLEYHDGRIEVKVSPKFNTASRGRDSGNELNRITPQPARRGTRAVPELRCTFEGRSIVPDVVIFSRRAHAVPMTLAVEYVDETSDSARHSGRGPIAETVDQEDQSEVVALSVANGCPLGWFLDPYRKTIDVFRPGLPPERLPADGVLDGAPVLPGFRLAVRRDLRMAHVPRPETGRTRSSGGNRMSTVPASTRRSRCRFA